MIDQLQDVHCGDFSLSHSEGGIDIVQKDVVLATCSHAPLRRAFGLLAEQATHPSMTRYSDCHGYVDYLIGRRRYMESGVDVRLRGKPLRVDEAAELFGFPFVIQLVSQKRQLIHSLLALCRDKAGKCVVTDKEGEGEIHVRSLQKARTVYSVGRQTRCYPVRRIY